MQVNREAEHIDPLQADEVLDAWTHRKDNVIMGLQEVPFFMRLDEQMHEPTHDVVPTGRTRQLCEIEAVAGQLMDLLDRLDP